MFFEDIDGGIVIAIELKTAVRASMPPLTQVFVYVTLTRATHFGGVMRRNQDDRRASFFRFAPTDRYKGTPCRIVNTFIQAALRSGSVGNELPGFRVFPGLWSGRHV